MAERIIIGAGPGRCGTVTLSRVFASQLNCTATHEDHPLLPWKRDRKLYERKLANLRARPTYYAASVGMDWVRYLDWLMVDEPTARVVVMFRDASEVTESFMKKTGGDKLRNHWSDEDDETRLVPPNIWDTVFPSYTDIPLADKSRAIRRYVEDWYATAATCLDTFCGNYLHILNDYASQRCMLEHCGFDMPVTLCGSVNNETKGGK